MYGSFGNPTMRRWARKSANGDLAVEINPATYKGVTLKSVFLVLLTIVVGVVTELLMWYTLAGALSGEIPADRISQGLIISLVAAGIAGVVMMVGSIVLIFNASAAAFVGPLYSVMQGVFLGALAFLLNLWVPWLSLVALLGTGIVFCVCLFTYKVLGARISSRFALGFLIAMFSFIVVELICVPILYFVAASSGNVALILGVQAGIALFCVIFATISVFWDIQNIDTMVQVGADKKYEWVLAYSLTTSLVYLYMEILELLVRIVALFAVNKNRN